MMGGDVDVESVPGEGTAFTVRLPRIAPQFLERAVEAAP